MGPKQYCYDVCHEYVFVRAFHNTDTPGMSAIFPQVKGLP